MQRPIGRDGIVAAVLAMAGALSTGSPAIAAEAGRVARVTFYTGGVAEIVRTAEVEGPESILVTVPVSQVSDVLKSLVLRGPTVRVEQVSLAGSGAIDASTPFDAGTLRSVPKLLDALRGVEIRLWDRQPNRHGEIDEGAKLSGTVMGVEFPASTESSETREPPYLAILDASGTIQRIAITRGVTVDVADDAVRAEIAAAVERMGQALSNATRTIDVAVVSEGERTVEVDYVVAAPVWKTSHRLVVEGDGKGRLQSWAIVENVSGAGWDDVEVILSSGSPVTLEQNLFDPYWIDRQEIPIFAGRQPVAKADRGTIPQAGGTKARAAADTLSGAGHAAGVSGALLAAPVAPSQSGMAKPVETAAALEGDVSVFYRVKDPVDLAAGETLSVPIVDAAVPADRIAVFTAGQGVVHPTAAIRFTNDTGAALPAGIVTVYDTAGFAGDSTLLPVPAGEERFAAFALDRKITINPGSERSRVETDSRIVDGVLQYETVSTASTTYVAENAAPEPRTLLIEHPKRDGWKFETNVQLSETVDAYRLETEIPADGVVKIRAVETRVEGQGFALVDASIATLQRFATGSSDPETAKALSKLAALQAEVTRYEEGLDDLDARRALIVEEQARLRQNLSAVGKSDLARTYLDKMRDQEEELTGMEAEREQLEDTLERAKDRVRAFIASL